MKKTDESDKTHLGLTMKKHNPADHLDCFLLLYAICVPILTTLFHTVLPLTPHKVQTDTPLHSIKPQSKDSYNVL